MVSASMASLLNLDNPLAFATGTKNNPDILSQGQMFKAEDHEKFIALQLPKIQGLVHANVFEFHSMSDVTPHTQLLNAIWLYHHKHCPDGLLLKHKSHICADGSQQQYGIDYWETYAPIIHWSTICLVIMLSTLLKLKSWQINYTQAFPQAPLDDDIFMQIPQGWYFNAVTHQLKPNTNNPMSKDTQHCIQLKQNLYGVMQATRNWYLHLQKGLLSHRFVQSNIDPCLFIQQDCILVVYTDDCLMFAHDNSIIDDLCKCLSTKFLLKDEGDIEGFLGIQITHMTKPDAPLQLP